MPRSSLSSSPLPVRGGCKPQANWYIFARGVISYSDRFLGRSLLEVTLESLRIPTSINNRLHRSLFSFRRFALMQGPFLGTNKPFLTVGLLPKKSAPARLALAFSFLFVLALIIAAVLPST